MEVSSSSSKKVQAEYERLYSTFGDEFSILRKIPVTEFEKQSFPVLAKGLDNMRQGKVFLDPGFDGVFGIIKVFADKAHKRKFEAEELTGQLGLGI